MANKLVSFLKEHGAYDNYVENIAGGVAIEDLEDHPAAISRAFVWDVTPQGGSYWRELHYEFMLNYYTYKPSPHKVDTTWDNMWEE